VRIHVSNVGTRRHTKTIGSPQRNFAGLISNIC
jgi:hypothetical protein